MGNLIKKWFGKSKQIRNPSNIPEPMLELLHSDLKLIDKTYKGAGERLFSYVVDGLDESILLELSGFDKASEALKLRQSGLLNRNDSGTSAARREIFKKIDLLRPEVAYRLAQVYHTAWKTLKGAQPQWPHLAPEVAWLETFILESFSTLWKSSPRTLEPFWQAETLAAILEAGGHPSGTLAELILMQEPVYGSYYHDQRVFEAIGHLGPYFSQHPDVVEHALSLPNAPHRIHVLQILKAQKTDLRPLIPLVLDLALGSSKTVRAEADLLLINQQDAAKAEIIRLLETKLKQGSATERFHAVGLLVKVQGHDGLDFLTTCLETEKAKKVIAEIQKHLMIKPDASANKSGYSDDLDPGKPEVFPSDCSVTPEMEQDLLHKAEQFNMAAMEEHARMWDRTDPRWRKGERSIKPPLKPSTVTFICKGIQTPDLVRQGKQPGFNLLFADLHLIPLLTEFVKNHQLDLVPMIRLGFLFGLLKELGSGSFHGLQIHDELLDWMAWYKREKMPALSLLDLAAAFKAAGLSEIWPARMYLEVGYGIRHNPLDLTDDEIWPFFHVHPQYLGDTFGLSSQELDVPEYWKTDYRKKAYQVLTRFPKPPQKFAPYLWEQALGTSKTERPLAQACLIHFPERDNVIMAALEDGRKDVRAAAAHWLGELNVGEAEKSIRKALAKEKHDEAKAEMMGSLEKLGANIEQFLNRKKLKAEAEKGLNKEMAKDLAWFPFDRLPEVHWEKNKQMVAPEIIKWFIVQTHKLKKPEPGPLHRLYFNLMDPAERKTLGNLILESWLAQDTLPKYNQEEAAKQADRDLVQLIQYTKQYPHFYPDFNEEQSRKSLFNHYLNECLGSANSSKGILAVSAACCGPEAVEPVERYLKKWFGKRMAQCRALLRMLSWVDHPLAIQLILSTATRFRTKGIQKEALVIADLIAERKGWTLDEMADRTIPTAGFDLNGLREIDYGLRQFTARLLGDFSIQLENQSGKVIKSLPAANKSENEEEIKAIKKDFSSAKKEIKQVLKHQKERFYEAMCTERTWRFEDWDMYLNNHPIVSRYCRRLVWMTLESDPTADAGNDTNPALRISGTFRPTSDRTLTDYHDEPINLAPDQLVQIAYQSFLTPDDCQHWREHLKDYEIEPLFEQFRESGFQFSPDNEQQRELTEFEGYLVNSFKLRTRMNKLGYTRGAAEDGGWFYTYHKNFPGQKRQAVIEFTGNVLPEENRTVALHKLYFTALKDDSSDGYGHALRPIRLTEVPAVMVMECANDLKQAADDGSGYDEDWEKKSEY